MNRMGASRSKPASASSPGKVDFQVIALDSGAGRDVSGFENLVLELQHRRLVDVAEPDAFGFVNVKAHVEARAERDDLLHAGLDAALDDLAHHANPEANEFQRRRKHFYLLLHHLLYRLVHEPRRAGVVEQLVFLLLLHGADGRYEERGCADFVDDVHCRAPLGWVRRSVPGRKGVARLV